MLLIQSHEASPCPHEVRPKTSINVYALLVIPNLTEVLLYK